MKQVFSILFLFVFLTSRGQSKQRLVWEFADSHIGQKVGDGLCRTLINDAYKSAGVDLNMSRKTDWLSRLGNIVSSDSVSQGDVVLINYKDKKGCIISAHIGIVYAVSESNITIANQNTYSRLKDSEVEVTVLSELMEVSPGESSECYFFHIN